MRMLIGRQEIARRVAELGGQITRDYAGAGELVLVGMLRGAICFLADLMRAVDLPVRVDLLALRSYEGVTGGEAEVMASLLDEVAGKHVVLVEDILERGTTLAAALALLAQKGAASSDVCALMRKPEGLRTAALAPVRYVGFDIGPEFVVGYGLDHCGLYRNLPDVMVLGDEEVQGCTGTNALTGTERADNHHRVGLEEGLQ